MLDLWYLFSALGRYLVRRRSACKVDVGYDRRGGAKERRRGAEEVDTLLPAGAQHTGKHLLGMRPARSAVATTDLPCNYRWSKGAFGLAIGRIDVAPLEEGEKSILLMAQMLGEDTIGTVRGLPTE